MRARHRSGGFTLIELVMVIVLIGIIGAAVSSFMTGPIRAYVDQARRAALVDAADGSLRRIAREIRLALPNSVRVRSSGGVHYLELIRVAAGGRYCDQPGDCADPLDFTAADDGFSLTVPFAGVPADLSGHRLVIYNDGTAGANAYAQTDVVTPAGALTVSPAGDHVAFPSFRFAHRSPSKRAFLVEGPVTIRCAPAAGTLHLLSGYGWHAAQPVSFAGGRADLLARDVSSCSFSYDPGASWRAGMVMLELTLSRDGESVTLFHQVQVVNAP